MSSKNKTRPTMPQKMLQHVAGHEEEALAFLLLAALGTSLGTLVNVLDRAIQTRDVQFIMLCCTAGVQVRCNVVFVGGGYAAVRTKYPEVIVEGDRDTGDVFNFGALHALGHMVFSLSRNDIAVRSLAKAGNCITGREFPDTEAGNVNKEIQAKWTKEEIADWEDMDMTKEDTDFVEGVFNGMASKAQAFTKVMSGVKTVTATPPTASSAPTPTASAASASSSTAKATGT